MRLEFRTLALLSSLMLAGACTGDSNDPSDPENPDDPNEPDFWLVGDGGTMLGVTASGAATGYPLEGELDLLAIACFGQRTAYVVGQGGTILQTRDAGRTWDSLALGEGFEGNRDWWAVAPAEATPEGLETVWIVGDEGAVGLSRDGGRSWTQVEGPSARLRGVATRADGDEAIAVAESGAIWQLTADHAELVYEADAALYGVGMAAHGGRVVAVGAEGTMVRSEDGLEWTAVELELESDLHAVRVAGHEDLSVAVGAEGVVVRVVEGVSEVRKVADAEAGLHGLHLRHDGTGQAVGGAGVLLRTEDAGQSWTTIALPTTATLRGVDDFHEGGHL